MMDKDGLLWELDSTIKDLARQETTEYRCRYFGEAKGMLKSLCLLRIVDDAEAAQLRLKLTQAHDQAIKQCLAAGQHIDPVDLRRHELHLADDAEAAQLRMRGQPRDQEIRMCLAAANARKKIAQLGDARDGSDLEHRHAVAVGWLSALRLEGLVDGCTFDALYAELEAAVRTVGDSLPPAD